MIINAIEKEQEDNREQCEARGTNFKRIDENNGQRKVENDA